MSEIEWTRIRQRAQQALKRQPDDVGASRQQVQATVALGEAASPPELMGAHLARHPEDAHGWNLQCAYLLAAGRLEEALEASASALHLAPAEHIFAYNRACALALLGRADEALADLARAIACDAELAGLARDDDSFATLRHRPAFTKLVAGA
jgi:predicted Zn-dependent protease